jgi:alpha-tubulin suppressor-like RCC1 family protein
VKSGNTPGGQAYCWGFNQYGEVGNGNTDTPQTTPVPVSNMGHVTAVVAGQTHACAIALSGLVHCWGANESGQLGNNSTSQSSKPVSVSGLTGVVQLALGASFSCALTNTGSVYCWGSNVVGQLGNGTMPTNSPIPVAVSGIGGSNPAVSIAASNSTACAVLVGGQVQCWGDNGAGELGDPSVGASSSTPVTVPGFTSNGSISGNPNGAVECALNTSNQAYCWGDNYFDELGDGSSGGQSNSPVMVQGT